MPDTTIPISATIFRGQVAQIDQIAAAEERTRSQVMRRLINRALAEYPAAQAEAQPVAADRPAAAFLSAGSGK